MARSRSASTLTRLYSNSARRLPAEIAFRSYCSAWRCLLAVVDGVLALDAASPYSEAFLEFDAESPVAFAIFFRRSASVLRRSPTLRSLLPVILPTPIDHSCTPSLTTAWSSILVTRTRPRWRRGCWHSLRRFAASSHRIHRGCSPGPPARALRRLQDAWPHCRGFVRTP